MLFRIIGVPVTEPLDLRYRMKEAESFQSYWRDILT